MRYSLCRSSRSSRLLLKINHENAKISNRSGRVRKGDKGSMDMKNPLFSYSIIPSPYHFLISLSPSLHSRCPVSESQHNYRRIFFFFT